VLVASGEGLETPVAAGSAQATAREEPPMAEEAMATSEVVPADEADSMSSREPKLA